MSDEEMIAQFIATRGVTRCPAAYAAETRAEISAEDRAAHAARAAQAEVEMSWSKHAGRGVGVGGMPAHWRNKRLELQRSQAEVLKLGQTLSAKKIQFTAEMDLSLRLMLTADRPIRGYIDKALNISWGPIKRRAAELGLPIPKHGHSGRPAASHD
jgi:hypothetical protein